MRSIDDQSEILGGISLTNIRRGVAQTGTLGYWTGSPYRNQGLMREAVLAVCTHAFSELQLHRVEAATILENEPSQRLLATCRFEREGLARAYLRINGTWRDHILFARLSGDDA